MTTAQEAKNKFEKAVEDLLKAARKHASNESLKAFKEGEIKGATSFETSQKNSLNELSAKIRELKDENINLNVELSKIAAEKANVEKRLGEYELKNRDLGDKLGAAIEKLDSLIESE